MVKAFYMDGAKLIVGKRLHKIEDDPIHYKNGETQYKPTGGLAGVVQHIKQAGQKKVVRFHPHQQLAKH